MVNMIRKTSFLLLIAVLALSVLAGCGAGSGSSNSGGQNNANAGASGGQNQAGGSDAGGNKDQVVNVYSARHYDVDAQLYEQFSQETGIQVNVIEGKANELIERIKREGESTAADLFITVDGGILNTAKKEGILQPVESAVIDSQVPAEYRDPDNHWIGLLTRARVIVYAKDRVEPEELSTYEDLASDKWKGKVLVRSSTNMYNQSLLASLIALEGEEKVEEWARGIVANMARDPEGGDRDQAKAVVAGIGDVAIMNTYYVGQLAHSEDPEEVKVAEQVGIFFPNQETTGTHVNISGAGLIKHSRNKENAIRLIEYLTGEEAQNRLSSENFEFPVNPDAELPELLKSWGEFKKQEANWAALGDYNQLAVQIMNKVGWK